MLGAGELGGRFFARKTKLELDAAEAPEVGAGRGDGPAEAIAHGLLRDGPVDLYAADTTRDQEPFSSCSP